MDKTYKEALIICDENIDLIYDENIFYVCVERGALACIRNNIKINLAVSDFDSVTPSEFLSIKNNSYEIIKYNKNKDYIDGELAILNVISRGITQINMFISSKNNRIDMFFVSVLFANNYNINVYIDDNLIIPLILQKETKIEYEKFKKFKYFSVVPICKSKIKINNCKYNNNELILNPFSSHALSNELLHKKNGNLFLIEGKCVLFFIK